MKKGFHLMAKPASFHCNLACDYCFYLPNGETVLHGQPPSRAMSEPVLRQFIKRYIESSPGNEVAFTWQGGEPTLAGLDFYRRAVALQKQYAGNKRITNSMQTNGVLINDEWARFLAEHHFLMGISVDGPQPLYDAYRKTQSGGSVFHKVVDAIGHLKRHGVAFNLLAVVNDVTAQYPLEIYRFLTQELGGQHLQFIPAVEPMPRAAQAARFGETIALEHGSAVAPWSVSGEAYGRFLITLFDEWVRRDVGRVFVQMFDNTLTAWTGNTPELCVMQPTCGAALVVEQNGDVYSCDHFVAPEHHLGNILRDAPDKLVASKQQRRFGNAKTPTSPSCQRCEYRFACQGGCPKHRLARDGKHRQNHLCSGYYAFFRHAAPYMTWMAQQLARRQPPAEIINVAPFIAAKQRERDQA